MQLTHLKIITPDGIFYEGDIDIVTVQTSVGRIGLQHGKSPIVASLEISELNIGSPKSNKAKACAIAGGLVYVTTSSVEIITDAIEYREKIDVNRAQREIKAAEARLKQKLDGVDELKTKLSLKRALNRIAVKSS